MKTKLPTLMLTALTIMIAVIGIASATVVTHTVDGYTYSIDVPHIPVNAYDHNNEGKYVPIAPDLGDGTGHVYLSLLCHNNLISSTFTIQRVDPGNVTFASGAPASPQLIARMKLEGNSTTMDIGVDGLWDDGLAPGTYLLSLPDGNGGQPESALVRVAFGSTEYVTFIGHSVSFVVAKPTPSPEEHNIRIIAATYGAAWTTEIGKKVALHGKYVNVRDQLQALANEGETSIQFDAATIRGANGHVEQVTGGDPDSGIVKNAIVLFTDNGHLHLEVVMEQDYPQYAGNAAYIPYPVATTSTTLNIG